MIEGAFDEDLINVRKVGDLESDVSQFMVIGRIELVPADGLRRSMSGILIRSLERILGMIWRLS